MSFHGRDVKTFEIAVFGDFWGKSRHMGYYVLVWPLLGCFGFCRFYRRITRGQAGPGYGVRF